MKKLFMLVSIILELCVSSLAQVKKVHAPKRQGWDSISMPWGLYGDVDSIIVKKYTIEDRFGEIVRIGNPSVEVLKFNMQGDVAEWSFYIWDDGPLDKKILFEYDSLGRLIKQTKYNWDGSLLKYDSVKAYKYDTEGNMVEESSYHSDGSLHSKWYNKYDSIGTVTERANYDSNGSLNYKYIYKHDSAGNIIEVTEFVFNSLINKRINKYNSAGNLTETIETSSDGSSVRKWVNKYDSVGNMVEEVGYDHNGLLTYKDIYTYDSERNLVEKIYYSTEIMIPKQLIEIEISYRK